MIVQIEITVSPAVSSVAPVLTSVGLCSGILSAVVIRPPPGPNWEVYTRILHLENAIIPDDNENWIPLEREVLRFEPHFTNWKNIYKITIELCAPQARFTHTIQYSFTVSEHYSQEQLLERLLEVGF